MDHLQQRCKQQRPLTPVQLHAMSGDIMSCMATVAGRPPTAVPLRGRLKVLFSNAFELEVEQGTVGML